jgi:acyl carrier protein
MRQKSGGSAAREREGAANAPAPDSEGKMEIENKVREIVCQQLDVEPGQVKMETSFVDDLGADSLAVVELVLALEEAFEIDVPDEDTEKLRTFKDAVEYISAKVSG